MSFGGGGREQFTLEYVIKVVNQGGASGINQLNQGFQQTATSANQAIVSSEKLAAASNRVSQAQMGLTKSIKSTAFGMFGITTAGAEMFGMLSMLQQVQQAQKEAQEEQTQALKEGGKESKAYKDATAEVVKVNRWASMTTRNFMLSIFDMIPFTIMAVHGLTKMATASKELKAAKAAAADLKLLGFNASGVAANMLRAGTSIGGFTPQISKFSKATTIAQTASFKLGAETVKNTKFFGAGEAALISNAVALGKTEKAATSASKAMRVLGIAMKIAIPLIALEIGSQAYERNWGGFRDRINEVGVAIGKAIPQLQGFLNLAKKVGESVVAIFTGNWERIGSIWNPVVEGGEKAVEITEKERKAMEELAEATHEFNAAAFDTLSEAAAGDRGEQRDFLKSMGLDKDARKDMRGVLDDIEEIDQAVHGFHNAIDTMRTLNLMQKFGLDVPNQSWKEIAKGLSNIFEDLGDRFPGEEIFDQFAEKMDEASKKKGPAVIKSMVSFLGENKNFLPFLKEHSPEVAAQLTTMLEEAGYKVDASGMVTGVGIAVENAFKSGSILDPNAGETKNVWFGSKKIGQEGAGPLQPIVDSITENLKKIPGIIQAQDWNAIGLAIGNKLDEVFAQGGQTANKVGTFFHMNVVLPAMDVISGMGTALAAAAAPWWQRFKTDPIGALFGEGGLTQPVGDFVAGILGFASEDTMFTFFQIKLKLAADKFVGYFRQYFHNQEMTKNDPGSGGMDWGQGPGFSNWIAEIEKQLAIGYANFMVMLNENPNVQQFRRWFHDPVGALLTLIKTLGNVAAETKAAETAAGTEMEVYTIDQFLIDSGIKKWIEDLPTAQEIVDHIAGLPVISDIINFYNMAKKGGWEFLKYIWDAGGKVSLGLGQAEGATGIGSNDTKTSDPLGLNLDEILGNIPESMSMTVPEIVVEGETYTSAPLPEIINPPLGTNATPTPPIITTPNGIIKPSTLIPDISGSKIQQVWGDLDKLPDGTAPNGPEQPTGYNKNPLLLIKVPSATVQPQAVNYDFSQAKLTNISLGDGEDGSGLDLKVMLVEAGVIFEKIGQMWDEKVVAKIADGSAALSSHWSEICAQLAQNAADGAQGIMDEFAEALQNVYDTMVDLGQQWSEIAAEIAQNAADSAQGITDEFENMVSDAEGHFDDMLGSWSDTMDDMVSAAADAAEDIQNEMDSIKDTESTHTINVVRSGSVATGGQISLAQGGIISAASGKLLTTRGPTYLIGDNPGGTESIWAIPHNNPAPTIQKIDRMYGISRSGSGGAEFNQTLNLRIDGSDIINTVKLDRKIRTTIGNKRDRFG